MPTIVPSHRENIQSAAVILRHGGLIAMPTETVYGLAGNAYDDDAIRLIYHTKARPAHNPLIIHIANADDAYNLAEIPANSQAEKLINEHWRNDNPIIKGALTLVLNAKKNTSLSPLLITTQNSIAIRCPKHPIAKRLIQECNFPLAAPSANISGQLSPTCAIHVMQNFAKHSQPELILDDAEACHDGIESTIIDARDDALKLLRHGSLYLQETVLSQEKIIIAPGMLSSHYQPKSLLRLNATAPNDDEIMLGFGAIDGTLNLSKTGDLHQAAYHFYDYLHQLDKLNQQRKQQGNQQKIAVAPIPNQDIGIALNDRLIRASLPQDKSPAPAD